ncbi:MAG: M14 family zinc carboxypeptidase [Actinomycetota bacterium]
MRRIAVVLLVCLLIAALAPAGGTEEAVLALVRVRAASADQAAFLLTHFDETHNHHDGFVELLLWPGDEERLRAAGFDYEVVVEDVLARDIAAASAPSRAVPMPGPDRKDYRRLSAYVSEMKKLARKHPSFVRVMKLEHKTLEGRNVLGLEIAARVRRNDGRPTFYVDGVHHAREWPAAEYPMIFAHYLAEGFGRDRDITSLLERLRVVIVPVVNVDGFDYSRESLADPDGLGAYPLAVAGLEAYWRKNRRSPSGATVPQAQKNPDAYGVDPNRNYSYVWGDDGGGSSGIHVDQTYRGDAPFSEPETRSVRKLVLGRHVTGVITNHTYGNLVLRPWGHTVKDAPDERILAPLGARLARTMGGYTNQKGIGLYATTGTTDDWAYAAVSALGYTLEHGTAFHPPYGASVGKSFKGVLRAYMIMARTAADPDLHSVISGRVVDRRGRSVGARLFLTKRFRTPLGRGNPTGERFIVEKLATAMRAGRNGNFGWHVNPSTRPIASSKGGRESYTLTLVSRAGCRTLHVKVDRGERLNLGPIRLSDVCRGSLGKVVEGDPLPLP